MKNSLLLAFLGLSSVFFAQENAEKCGKPRYVEQYAQQHPEFYQHQNAIEAWTQNYIQSNPEPTRAIITIPVVVHVVYRTTQQNISNAQINSQITQLNKDFRLLNSDSLNDTHPFWQFTADSEIEFCLATKDPNGNPTTGITRTQTTLTSFPNEEMKFTSQGGMDNWTPTKYLNIWVCDISGDGLLGYAYPPGILQSNPDLDGVVINYANFGTTGVVQAPYHKGRTATHEIGHWLNLEHIWGDATCGNDFVADTREAEDANYGCPSFPHNGNNSCGEDANGEMYMNFMDYVDDACMNMFTAGQKTRMRAALNGPRVGLLTSQGCQGGAALTELDQTSFQLLPNPATDQVSIKAGEINGKATLAMYDLVGNVVVSGTEVASFPYNLNVSDLPTGVYFVSISVGNSMVTKKLVINQ